MRYIALILLTGCTTSPSGPCQNPVHDACTEKASEVSAELAKIAAERQTTSAQMTEEFVNACEGQVQADLDQTLSALQAIADGGTTP